MNIGHSRLNGTSFWYYNKVSKQNKKFEEITNNPHKVTFDDLCRFLGLLGYKVECQRGSHYKALKEGERTIYFVKPHGKGDTKYVKEIYVKNILRALRR